MLKILVNANAKTSTDILKNVNPITQKTLEKYVEMVSEQKKNNLKKIILFGSVARGEATKDSDIDVLIILKNRTMQDFKDVCAIAADIEWEMNLDENAYLQPIAISEEEAEGIEFWGLMNNVNREGVVLYDSQSRR